MSKNQIIDNKDNKRCIVLIPAYKKQFDSDEEKCVKRYFDILQNERISFIVPDSLDISYYEKTYENAGFVRYPDKFFKGILGYNKLMLSRWFYEEYKNYEYMLIAQPDATIWTDDNKLEHFMNLGYDYIGAPWIPARRIWEWARIPKENGKGGRLVCLKKNGNGIVMGNGGFSLRKPAKCAELIRQYEWRKCYWFIKRNEDIFFGVFGRYSKCDFKLADEKNGLEFAAEYNLHDLVESGHVPFGVHGWSKEFSSYDEMKAYLEGKGVWQIIH